MTELVTRQDLDLQMQVFTTTVRNSELRLENRMDTRFSDLESRIDGLELRLLVRLGGLIAVAVAVLAAIMKI